MDIKKLTAPCGIDCFHCQMYEGNLTETTRRQFAAMLKKDPGEVGCKGCREQGGCALYPGPCETLECARAKGVDFCHECDAFPCRRLAPASDQAGKYPHNLKLYNLCRIKAVGLEEWAEKEALQNRLAYFKGRFVVGKGPVVED